MSLIRTEQRSVDEHGDPLLPCGISRNEAKRRTARAWDRALRACSSSNEDVGSTVGVDEKRIRKQRSDDPKDLDVMPSAVDLMLADPDVVLRFLRELGTERERLHGDIPRARLVQAVSRAMGKAASFTVTCAAALEDGVIERTEIPRMEEDATAGKAAFDDLLVLFREVSADAVIK